MLFISYDSNHNTSLTQISYSSSVLQLGNKVMIFFFWKGSKKEKIQNI